MIAENKKRIDEKLNKIPDRYVADILDYLNALELKQRFTAADMSSVLLSEQSLAKEWLSKEEEDAWRHL